MPSQATCTYMAQMISQYYYPKIKKAKAKGIETLRLVVAYYYRVVLKGPPECEWDGKDGVIAKIRSTFEIDFNRTRFVRNTLISANKCIEDGIEYTSKPFFRAYV